MMTTSAPLESTSPTHIASDTTLGPVRLTVSQLERSRAFYEEAIGLMTTELEDGTLGLEVLWRDVCGLRLRHLDSVKAARRRIRPA